MGTSFFSPKATYGPSPKAATAHAAAILDVLGWEAIGKESHAGSRTA